MLGFVSGPPGGELFCEALRVKKRREGSSDG